MVLSEIGKFVGAKVAGTLITLAVIAGAIWAWQHPETIKAFGNVVKLTFVWILVAAALPWSSYVFMKPLLAWQSNMQSAGTAAVAGFSAIGAFTIIDILLALWLADWSISGGFTWFVVLLGFIAAAAYNYVICESLARHLDS